MKGLYAITPERICDNLPADAEAALRGGVSVLQYRDKRRPAAPRLRMAAILAELCRRYQVLFIVNDDVDLAGASGAGVHLGRDDMSVIQARQILGPDRIIGVSCYNSLSLAVAAQADGADYVAFGSFFPSPTKPGAVRATPALLEEARKVLTIPVVAIGGITADNAGELARRGADAVAVISDIFSQRDITRACRRYRSIFEVEGIQS